MSSGNYECGPHGPGIDFNHVRWIQERLQRHRKMVAQDLDELARFIADHPHTAQWLQKKFVAGKAVNIRPRLVVDNTRQPVSTEKRQPIKRYRPPDPTDAA
jgi:hypothetical protein